MLTLHSHTSVSYTHLEIPSFREDVARIYRQMLLCQETEKIDKKMREEIIPEDVYKRQVQNQRAERIV